MSLFWRLFAVNATVVVGAALFLALSPLTLIYPLSPGEQAWLAVCAVAVLGVIGWSLRRALRPLEELGAAMRRVRTPENDGRVPVRSRHGIGSIAQSYNAMLHRLEDERSEVARATLLGQEEERKRIARELHDEVGQGLTVVLLRLATIEQACPPGLRQDVARTREQARQSLDLVRDITGRLRPAVLDDLGVSRAITDLATTVVRGNGLRLHREIADVTGTTSEQDLVLYRIAQEALTNVVRHARAQNVWVRLRQDGTALVLEVADDGNGLVRADGHGQTGMRERARLVRGTLTVDGEPGRGTTVRLVLPGNRPPDPAGRT